MERKPNRLKDYDYGSPGTYFITICAKDKKNYFWENVGASIARPQDIILSEIGKIVEEAIKSIHQVYPAIEIKHYVIMPDHIHFLLSICGDDFGRALLAPTSNRVVQQMKGYITKKIGYSIWQKSFFDHIIRNRLDYEEHIKYIYENPVRWCCKFHNKEKY